MGIWSKNRAEWAKTMLACCLDTVTLVTIYDSLGPQAVEYVLKQTDVSSVACALEYVDKLISLKEEGKSFNLQAIVSFDKCSQQQ